MGIEMEHVVLQHCEEVQVYVCGDPADLVLMLKVGGAPGDGSVEVKSPQLPVPIDVPTGSSAGPIPIPACAEITLHYYKEPNGPSSIDISWGVTI